MGFPNSNWRTRPNALKLSMASPGGSILEWQEAHLGSARCRAKSSRCVGALISVLAFVSSSAGTFGGGGAGGAPRIFWRIHLPRFTGEVRVGFEVTVRTPPMVNTPPRT